MRPSISFALWINEPITCGRSDFKNLYFSSPTLVVIMKSPVTVLKVGSLSPIMSA